MKTVHFSFLMAAAAAPATQTANVETVMDLFACFGKGDVPGILAKIADNVDWLHNGDPALIPFAKHYHGVGGAAEFFQTVVQSIAVKNILPSNFEAIGDEVHHDFHVEADVPSTGKSYVVDAKYIWMFDDAGKICRYRSEGDMSPAEAAFSR